MRWTLVLCASWLILPWFAVAPRHAQAASATATGGQERIVDAFAYGDDHSAQDAWRSMWGTAPVSMAQAQGQRALRMTCNFAGTRIERAAWDRQVRLDLTRCQAVRFQFLCADPTPVSSFSIYFQSGDGWYAASFSPPQVGVWGAVTINKEDTRIEGAPAGWGQIRSVRISAWRGTDSDTAFYLRDMDLTGGYDSGITIIRGEPAAADNTGRGEAESMTTYTKAVAAALADAGLDYSVVSDRDLDSATTRLLDRSVRLLILPHNPAGMSDAAADAIAAYLRGGGKLLAFYGLPPRLADAAGLQGGRYVAQRQPGQFASIRFADAVAAALPGAPSQVMQRSWNIVEFSPITDRGRVAGWWHDEAGDKTDYPAVVLTDHCAYMSHVLLPDDPANKRQLLLAMAGYLVPDLWQQAARRSIDRIGRFASYQGFEQARAALSAHPNAAEALASAQQARNEASRLLEGNEPAQAMAAADRATRDLIRAWCLAQEPQPGEHRAFWCHSAFGVAGMDWDQSLKLLADNGFTAIVPNMLWGGVAYYDSKVLPVAPEVATRGDQIAQCLAAARKHGLQVHVWKVNWNMGWNAPKDFLQRMKQQGRTQVSFDGTANDQWLCPSHPANQQLEIDAMVEVATNYDVDGIHFDYIRYPGPDGCFCPGCRQRFEKALGRPIANWPQDVRSDEALRERWLDFRRDNITKVVAAVAEKVHATRPGVKVSAAVFPNWAVDRDNVGQDWKLWCERGYLDFVCPMDYTPGNTEFAGMVQRQLEWAGQVPCYPGIGLSTWPGASRDIVKLIEQIQIARKLGAKGFTIFEYNTAEAEQVVPLCGMGITRPEP